MSGKEGCCRRIFGCVVCLAIIGLSVGLSYYFLGGFGGSDNSENGSAENTNRWGIPKDILDNLPKDLLDHLPDISLFHREDPFNAANPDDANKWPTNGNGLELELVNALDSEWYEYFDIAVDDWENGEPDALTLTKSATQSDSECTEIPGVIKVCNGDYGETDWKGINKVLLENGWITTSMARMNDHFFQPGGDENKRQYTMCHEIGHGFGLPHTDESFWNRDLGNCLDYTTRYEGNKTPDDSNYEFLRVLYGTVGGGGGNNRMLRNNNNGQKQQRSSRHLFESVQDNDKRRELLDQWNAVDTLVNNGKHQLTSTPGWRMLHQTEYGEAHEFELNENFKIQLHMLRD